ncbi:MAG: plastocyanin [Candidatus Gottesmanbacteria bacterium GW2011_GWA2_43_14]|uniref:Plastocyanin n=1 Tax=Candidatus Gottesmanbacteria bacterium GW2011_GWA2_43_14 TaxID=1618443 RepID=A0A0G1DEX1_9BACT|nr:MAG: plastocyanin [Candidatus Gottesmanbacteria bacterium GW2011_GWA2_43_14]
MNKNLIIGIITVAILAVGGIYLMSNRSEPVPEAAIDEQELTVPENDSLVEETIVTPNQSDETMEEDSEVKTFEIDASNFKFSLSEIRVNRGDRVRIVLNNTGGIHNWVIDEFNAKTKQIEGPATDTVEFTADRTGTFEYYCSVGQHRQNGMVGQLIVE